MLLVLSTVWELLDMCVALPELLPTKAARTFVVKLMHLCLSVKQHLPRS